MKDTNPVETIATHLITKISNFNTRKDKLFRGDLRVLNIKEEYLKDDKLLDELGIFREVRASSFDANAFDKSVIALITTKTLNTERAGVRETIKGDSSAVDPSNFAVYVDIEAQSNYRDQDKFLVNIASGAIVKKMSINTYRHVVGNEVFNKMSPSFPIAVKIFDPYRINGTLKDRQWREELEDVGDVVCINECIHPDWRYNRDLDIKLNTEEIFFIESSFKTKKDLQYFIDSAYHTIVDKMWSYIMLYGIKGTGKTTLIEMLIPCIGKDNYRKAPQNALQKEFNGFKKNKRLVLMDEMVANTDKAINILKSDANKEFNVEEKNQITEAVKNYVSMWIATNNISDWKFTHDERRFSVLELVDTTTLERGIEDAWMSEFSQKIETVEFANALFNYLEEKRSKVFNTMAAYKSKAFYNVVYESLASWQMKIVDEIILGEKKDKIQLNTLFEDNDRYAPTTHKKVIDFLDNYRHLGEKLGEYDRGKSVKNSYVIPSEKYRAEKRVNFDLDKGV